MFKMAATREANSATNSKLCNSMLLMNPIFEKMINIIYLSMVVT